MAKLEIANQAAAAIVTPATGSTALFIDSGDKLLKGKDDAGVVTNYGASGNAISQLTGEVTATGPGSATATVTNSAVLGKVLTGLTPTSGTLSASDSILVAFNKLAAKLNQSWFPSATDGDVIISSNTTLVRDMYYNSLTINVGATLFTNGYRIFSNSSIENNGIIDRSGNDAAVNVAGAALPAGTLAIAVAGGAGGVAAGTAGTASSSALGGIGGAGGLGASGAGGAAGALTLVSAINGGVEILQSASRATLGRDVAGAVVTCGSGGGGGGGDAVAGGGGGGAGGIIVLVSRNIFGTGVISAHGGDGGTPSAGNRGGGGGGGGGVVVLVSENDTLTTSLTIDVAGGLGSPGTGTGVAGTNGSIGRTYRVRV